MKQSLVPGKTVLALSVSAMFSVNAAMAQSAPAADASQATVVVTGTRVANRSVLDTVAPVDVISAEALKNTGVTEISQALSVALPSLNFPRPALADGTDTIRPATLRGLSPDQSLVLVNSKRRHASALVNLNGTIGRGSAAVDLNAIPTAIIKNIEVLRDGASAQYGSDAIGGVINLRLRDNRDGGEFTTTYGARMTDYGFNADVAPPGGTWTAPSSRNRTDGQTATVSGWKGLPWGDTGFVTIAAEFKDQAHTERSGYDMRQQYPLVNGAYDPRELTINRYNAWNGEPDLKQSTLFVNAANNLEGGVKLYGWSSYQKRDVQSSGFFRRALQDQNVLAIYPDGFLPIIAPTVDDFSATGGVSWSIGEWDMDASLGYGKNKMQYNVENSLNASLGAASPTSFDAGGFSYDQLTFNLSGVRSLTVDGLASPLNVAVGTEVRREGYKLWAGEPDSYRFGGVLLPNGTPAPAGAQVFPGFRPSDASDNSRSALGAYVDLETNLSKQLLASVALRGEHYSDFGNNLSGKLAARYDFTSNFALRGSVQNGFRAPSPQQQFFTSTATSFINGVPYDITTFKPSDPAAVALGAKPLTPEKSVNFSFGAVARINSISLTADAYRINIRDRIVLSENLTATNVRDYLVAQGFAGIGGGRFFINGVDTTTQGLDVVASVPLATQAAGKFDFTLAANVNTTSVTKVPTTAQLTALNPAPVLFGRVNVLSLEQGQPKNKLIASTNWKLGAWGATLRATRYGAVLSPGTTAAQDFTLNATTLVDLEARYVVTPKMQLALGADNLFDRYPDALPASLNSTGNFPFANFSPFGRSGRFVYARMNYSL